MGSGGPSGTFAKVEAQARAPCCWLPRATERRVPHNIIESAMGTLLASLLYYVSVVKCFGICLIGAAPLPF